MHEFHSKFQPRHILFLLAVLFVSLKGYPADFTVGGLSYTVDVHDNSLVEVSKLVDKSITELVIPSSVQYNGKVYSVVRLGFMAFANCTGLTSVVIPSTVTHLGNQPFSGCTGLTSIEIPASVTDLGFKAFANCTSLTSIVIPSTVTGGEATFSGCTGLTSVVVLMNTIPTKMFSGCTGLTSIVIPNSVHSVGMDAFGDCTSLTSVSLEDGSSPLSITGSAFSNCPIETLYIGRNGVGPFRQLKSIKSVTIGNSVTDIAPNAFSGCTGLSSVVIPNSVTTIGSESFSGCTGLTSIEIPASVTNIGRNAFLGCTGLTSIEIPASVTTTGFKPFGNCTGLTSIVVLMSTIPSNMFEGCTGLTSIVIPNSVHSVGMDAFGDCTSLTSVSLEDGSSPLSITGSAFSNCPIETLYIGRNGVGPFRQLKSIKSVTIGNSVTDIEPNAFSGCTGLSSVVIPKSVVTIDREAFRGCTGLTSIEIPSSVTNIAYNAFSGCTGLTSVYYGASDPIKGDRSIFSESSYESATLYVPEDAVALAKIIDPWKNFKNIQVDSSGIEEIIADFDEDLPYEIYNLNGVKVGESVEGLIPGIYIFRQGNIVKKIVVK